MSRPRRSQFLSPSTEAGGNGHLAVDLTMEVKSTLTRDDYWAYNRLVMARHLPKRRTGLLSLIVAFLNGLAAWTAGFFAAQSVTHDLLQRFIAGAALTLTIGFIEVLASKNHIRSQVKAWPSEAGHFMGDRVLTVSAEGVREETSAGHGFRYWHAIRDIVEDANHVFLLLDNEAFIVPKRAFEREDEGRKFVGAAIWLWKNSVQRSPNSSISVPIS